MSQEAEAGSWSRVVSYSTFHMGWVEGKVQCELSSGRSGRKGSPVGKGGAGKYISEGRGVSKAQSKWEEAKELNSAALRCYPPEPPVSRQEGPGEEPDQSQKGSSSGSFGGVCPFQSLASP